MTHDYTKIQNDFWIYNLKTMRVTGENKKETHDYVIRRRVKTIRSWRPYFTAEKSAYDQFFFKKTEKLSYINLIANQYQFS